MQNDIQATASNNDEVIKKTEQAEEVEQAEEEETEQEEQVEEETDEQTGDEEQAEQDAAEQAEEQTQEQIELQAKIDDIDAKIEQYRINAVQARKEQAMRRFNYSDEQISKYVKFIEGDTADEIDRSVLQLSKDIAPNNYYGDPSLLNGAAAKPKAVDKREIGRNAVKRIMSKIRL